MSDDMDPSSARTWDWATAREHGAACVHVVPFPFGAAKSCCAGGAADAAPSVSEAVIGSATTTVTMATVTTATTHSVHPARPARTTAALILPSPRPAPARSTARGV